MTGTGVSGRALAFLTTGELITLSHSLFLSGKRALPDMNAQIKNA